MSDSMSKRIYICLELEGSIAFGDILQYHREWRLMFRRRVGWRCGGTRSPRCGLSCFVTRGLRGRSGGRVGFEASTVKGTGETRCGRAWGGEGQGEVDRGDAEEVPEFATCMNT